MDCRIVLAQTRPGLGEVSKNLEDHLAQIDAARRAGAQMVLFPELSLTGYFLKDQTAELCLDRESPVLARLAEASREISIAVGFVERSPEGRLYNAMAFLEDGVLLHVHRKVHLVTYGMFEESRDFAAGERFEPVASKHGRLGLLLCEDAWHVGGPYLYFLNDVDALVVASSSPARGVGTGGQGLASTRVWNSLLTSMAHWFQIWICYVNRVGWEDGISFGGGSRVIDPFGELVCEAGRTDEQRLEARLAAGPLRRARVQTPLRRDEKPWIVAAEMQRLAGWPEAREDAESS